MYVIKSNRKTNSYTVRKINRVTQVVRVGRRGLQGDPATNLVQSVNGKQGIVVLNATDVGADPTGSSAQALQDAKDYTDTEVSTLDSSLATVAKTGSYNDLSNKPTIPSTAGLATEGQVQDVQDNLDAHEADTANPHSVTKAQVGLGNVDNTSDADKPVSAAQQTALNAKANASDTVNLTGNQTVAGVKTFSSSPVVPTATTNTQAVNKAQMDAADALNVKKTGDTMTGLLSSTIGALGYSQVRGSSNIAFGVGGNGNFVVYSNTNSVMAFSTYANGSGISIGDELISPRILKGSGFPNGVVTAPVGSTYIDTNATNGAVEWKKATGTGPTGWVVSVGDTGWRNVTSLFTNLEVVNPNDNGLRWRRVNGVCYIEGNCQIQNTSTTPMSLAVSMAARADASIIRFDGQGVVGEVIDYKIVNTTAYPVPSSSAQVGRRGFINSSYGARDVWVTTLPGTAV